MLLLHGGPGADHSLFKPEFSALTDLAQIVCLDQRGSGRSDFGSPATWTWQQWANEGLVAGLIFDSPLGARPRSRPPISHR